MDWPVSERAAGSELCETSPLFLAQKLGLGKRNCALGACFAGLAAVNLARMFPRKAILLLIVQTAVTTGLHSAESPSIIAPGAKLRVLAEGFKFTEGPAADKHGNVYFTDQPNDRIVKWSTDGKTTDWLKPAGRSNGTYFDRHGNLIACADEKNELWSIAPDKKVTVLIKDFGGKLLNGPNDLWIRPDGNIYFTDPLYARDYWKRDRAKQQPGEFVYYYDLATAKTMPVATDLKQPNGIIGTPDGKTLYVADIGAGKTYRYHTTPEGQLTDKQLFCELGSDGMTIDEKGNVYLTGKGVTIFDPSGNKITNIPVPEPWTANVTFGGADKKLLFITASTKVYGMDMAVRGAQ